MDLSRDVALELLAFGFEQVDAGLHQVTDAHDADELVVLDHGHVPEPALGHDAGDILDLVGGSARGDARGHDVGDAQLQEPGPAEVQPPHDVALGDDADEAIVLEHGERADVVLGEGGDQIGDGRRRLHRGHRRTFAAQNVRDSHDLAPAPIAVGVRRGYEVEPASRKPRTASHLHIR